MNRSQPSLKLCALAIVAALSACGGLAPSGEPGVEDTSESLRTGGLAPLPMPHVAVTLQNGWTNAPFSTRNAAIFWDPNSGIVHLSGAVSGGSSSTIFTVGSPYKPDQTVYVPVDLCDGANGRLIIQTDGTVSVQAQNSFSDAQCFTSLEGATWAIGSAGFSAATLQNGWTVYFPGTLALYGQLPLGSAIRFHGSIKTSGTNPVAFTLPSNLSPSTDVYIPADLFGAKNGRLHIQPNGTVTVQAESSFSDAAGFTSLDGTWFLPNSTGTTALTLVNGWTNAPFSTANAAVINVNGIVHFKGAIASGTTGVAFTVPSTMRPSADVYLPIDLCNATKGRLYIAASTGVATVSAEGGTFSNAQCFTSLESASYSIAGF